MDLDYHLGFPMGESLSCPIFTQNKLNYLSAIRLKSLDKYTDHDKMLIFASESEILQWSNVDDIEYELNKITKWVLKFPFMTNCDNRFWCKDNSTLMKRILQSYDADDIGKSVPYGLIQPWSTNGKEYKVIVLDGKSATKLKSIFFFRT